MTTVWCWQVGGRVQGVGFRPFVYRLALRHGLRGWVRNRLGDVEILAQGRITALAGFEQALLAEAPPLARPRIIERATQPPQTLTGFAILESDASEAGSAHLPADGFLCDDCLRELGDPHNRRYRYPFINCTQCGPRYTIIRRLPYDRANTGMADFVLCPACRTEYANPADRRFHAEPLACPDCGPQLQFYSETDDTVDSSVAALAAACNALHGGALLAVKGIGGYHLLCDARNRRAIERLRRLKPRPDKPLAVMFPWRGVDGLEAVREAVHLRVAECEQLRDPSRPIVLADMRRPFPLSAAIAPGLGEIGVLLPYSPLHQLLLADFGAPLVATSGNLGGEPVLTDAVEAEARLGRVADAFLHHDRPILRPADDSVVRTIAGRPRPLRLGRGSAPLELDLPVRLAAPVLAVGGHMKNTVALAWENRAVLSPHIGDLASPRALAIFEQTLDDLQALYRIQAARVLCDAHPGYASTRWARHCGLPVTAVWHHYAHAAALAGEHPHVGRWLVFTWDGAGLGEDGELWGGEALLGRPGHWKRAASLRPFRLPGGEKAAREPWRSALALCWECGLEWPACPEDTTLLRAAWSRQLNAPVTTAAGRLFDAAAAFTGINLRSSFEGQGPMWLEAAADGNAPPLPLPLSLDDQNILRADWAPLLPMLMDTTLSPAGRAACFHASLAQALVDQAVRLRAMHGPFAIGLSGGVFQNRRLSETALEHLQAEGFAVHLPEQVPCNDGGLCYGQIIEGAHRH